MGRMNRVLEKKQTKLVRESNEVLHTQTSGVDDHARKTLESKPFT